MERINEIYHRIEENHPTLEFAKHLRGEINALLTHGCRTDVYETRTSYRIQFEYGPVYNENGFLDGYQHCTIILHKDRPVRQYSIVFKQPDYIGRKHDLKPYLYELFSPAFDKAARKTYVQMVLDRMTVREVCEKLGIWHQIDYAVPQTFADRFRESTGRDVHTVVWIYDEQARYGRPYALTNDSRTALLEYNAQNGTRYPVDRTIEDEMYGEEYSQLDELQDKAEAHKRNWHKDT